MLLLFNIIKMSNLLIISLLILKFSLVFNCSQILDPTRTKIYSDRKSNVWNLKPALPIRYFFIEAYDVYNQRFISDPPLKYQFNINGNSPFGNNCRFSHEIINRGDGSTIIRYKIADFCENIELEIKYNGTHVAKSPYQFRGRIYSEKCYCPQYLNDWLLDMNCPVSEKRIDQDLKPFKKINFTLISHNILKTYTANPGSTSLCHYIVFNQEVHRKCYGKYVGFKMFMDETLMSLLRIVKLPNMEFYLNLGDWPLVKKGGHQRTTGPYPIISWCGSDDTFDIVLPTYDLMESSRELMGRVSLDMLSVQKNQYEWNEKENKAFWRGRDSRRERLKLIEMSRENPDLINASLTNFFFFRDEEEKYGPTVAHISFLEFFKYKYQINIDGSVAAYRLPYLLGGNSLVFKQDSKFYEHFYSKLIPFKHYIPFKRDLSNLIEKIQWAKENDETSQEIVKSARKFVEENLLPKSIYCYHMTFFKEYSTRIINPIIIQHGMEKLTMENKCTCIKNESRLKDEL